MLRINYTRVRTLSIPAILFILFSFGCTKEEKTIVQASTGDASWHTVGALGEPGFLSGWGNYSSALSSCAFRKDGQNIVHLKGSVTGGNTGAATTIFNLPVGYMPSQELKFIVLSNNTTQSSAVAIVPANDTLCQVQNTSTYFGFITLDGISFVAEK